MENAIKSFEPSIDHFIRIIGSGIEIFGVLVIVTGIRASSFPEIGSVQMAAQSLGLQLRMFNASTHEARQRKLSRIS